MLRYMLDEHIPVAVADGLRRVGIDVVTAHAATRKGTADADHLARCAIENRVVVTHDVDNLQLHATGVPHFGIVWIKFRKDSLGSMIELLEILSAMYDMDEFANRLDYL